jgi:ribonuclease R
MHRLGDVVDVRLVEAQPIAGALRFELLSEGQLIPRGRKRAAGRKPPKTHPGRNAREEHRRPDQRKSGKAKSGKAKRGKSWKP